MLDFHYVALWVGLGRTEPNMPVSNFQFPSDKKEEGDEGTGRGGGGSFLIFDGPSNVVREANFWPSN